ncbi:glucose-6-phosphate dehydrogenase [Candidatus Uhrbacteria bacterium]|nr:glucose-6-phosphate dehydrogenase [Candidatus Uhrbacteria bacterium]
MQNPTVLILFGATGDLVAKKIVPALYNLHQKRKLPEQFRIVAFARRPLSSEQYRAHVTDILASRFGHASDPDGFLGLFEYVRGQFDSPADYASLRTALEALDTARNVKACRLFYLAVPPDLLTMIFRGLRDSGLGADGGEAVCQTRMIVEKPIGVNTATAEEIERALSATFTEPQIYRVDHYLGKEMVQNILSFRFSNSLFEQAWNARFIERIHIRLWETIGVESRGAFYDGLGALRDVGQNHLLQMLAFVTMDHPQNYDAAAIRAKRAELLNGLRIPTAEAIRTETYRAQYDGYRTIAGVAPESKTETYFKIRAELDTPRWKGVPVIMESGKRMGEQRKEIVVTYRTPSSCLCPSDSDEHLKNTVTFRIEPEESIMVEAWLKKPGLENAVEKRSFDMLLRRQEKRMQYVEEYEKLLLDCIAGDQTLFLGSDEVRAMWRFTDPIVEAWQRNEVPLDMYPPDTHQPTEQSARLEETNPAGRIAKELAILGLGKMGGNMARRMVEQGWRVVGWNRTHDVAVALSNEGIEPAESFAEIAAKLPSPRVIWLMLPAGDVVDETLFGPDGIVQHLSPGDIVIDGGNSYFKDAPRRAKLLDEKGIRFMDCGTSGGPGGARRGACLMVGGTRTDFERFEHLYRDFAREDGVQFFDGHGAGHFVKMIHNGIEYGMMQAIAEGFEILKRSDYSLDLSRVADIYSHGSVIESRLVEWLAGAFRLHGQGLDGVTSTVAHTGEGAWTVETAAAMGIETKIIEGALEFRKQSAEHPSYAGKVLSALREQFGGHKA